MSRSWNAGLVRHKSSWVVGVCVGAVVFAACSGDDDGAATPNRVNSTVTTAATLAVPPPTTPARTTPTVPATSRAVDGASSASDSVPMIDTASDTGCLDQPGSLSADAEVWYPTVSSGWLHLAGEHSVGPELGEFEVASAALVGRIAPGFVATDRIEFRAQANSCATHRYLTFERGQDSLVVSAWRVVAAADPFWVPNETPFDAIDEGTLVSDGEHLDVVLAVAPDGTTARVTAYGSGARALVAGWPTTIPAQPSTPEPGASPLQVAELAPLAHEILALVVNTR